jgi:hypothetical protein
MGIVRKKVVIYCISSETLNDPGIRSMLYMCVLCTADYGSNVMFFYFQTNNFIGLNWCDFCANFMWGLIAQGSKCQG